jgi:hypothetical protein
MKKVNSLYALVYKSVFVLGLTALIFSVSCTSEIEPTASIDDASVEADLIAQADFEEVDDMTSNVMAVAEGGIGGRVTGFEDDRCQCAVVTHDKENQVITIDFGDGCTGPNGVVRSGKIIINYDGQRFVPGSYWVITFEEFYINRRHIEGVRTVTNVSESLDADPKFHVVLEGGKVTWPDETFATREVDRVRVWIRASNPLLDEFHILARSTAEGTTRKEINYSTLVLEDLVYKKMCRGQKRGRIPVSGVKEVIFGGRTFIIDFGDGECDTIVTITTDGETKTVDLSDR